VRVLDRLVRQAREARAPKRQSSGLPAIGRPATNALAACGITTLDQVAEHTERDLRALHAVGPKAIRILKEALAADGRAFRT
jgi:predicted flap endonuclease-1-like 5' DNA nuclease